MTYEQAIARPQPVCVFVDSSYYPRGVLVQALGERFVIEALNLNEGAEMHWDEAMAALKAAGKTTFSKKQAQLILYLFDAIDFALMSFGGDAFPEHCWTSTKHTDTCDWGVNFKIECLQFITHKCKGAVRPIIDIRNY